MLTPDELEDWISKRTAQSAAETGLHVWDWQAMCRMKAELAETEARRQESFAFYEDARRQIASLQSDLKQSTRVGVTWMERAKTAEADLDIWKAKPDRDREWRQEALAQIRTLTERRDEIKAERDRLRSICSFNRFDLDHKPSYVLNCLYEGEISLAKACEWLRRYADGVTDPIVEGVVGSGGWEGSSPKELAAECDRLRGRVTSAEESKIRLQWDLDTANAGIIERADEAARLRDTLDAQIQYNLIDKRELSRLRSVVLNQAGDNLCRFDTVDDARREAQILPERDFLESCRRYRNQIAQESGELYGGMTISQLEADNQRLRDTLDDVRKQLADAKQYL
jgi:hypothetical protein